MSTRHEKEERSNAGDHESTARSSISAVAAALILACGTLTRLPVPQLDRMEASDLRRSVGFYPLVGLLLGALLAAIAWPLQAMAIPCLGGVLLVTALSLLTGALHLDGVADFADAIGSGRDQKRMLEIMKDSRIGAHGACALILVLVAKMALFDFALHHDSVLFFLCVPVIARLSLVPVVILFKPARPSGLAHAVGGVSSRFVWIAWACQAALLFGALRIAVVAPLLAAMISAILLARYACARLSGTTGDVYGSAVELAEIAAATSWLMPA